MTAINWFDIKTGINGIDYKLIFKLKEQNEKPYNKKWLEICPNIDSIDYEFIDKLKRKYDEADIIMLEPPFINKCSHLINNKINEINKIPCKKLAAYFNVRTKMYYCFLHFYEPNA